jgi:hypothetical protein
MSAFGGKAENICSLRAFPLLTHCGSRAANLAVMHNSSSGYVLGWDMTMRRRAFITLIGGAAAWPLAARAQQSERMRRIGVLTNLAENDPEGQSRNEAFRQGLHQLGWTDGGNVRIDYRGTLGDAERTRRYAAELVALAPDVILATGSAAIQHPSFGAFANPAAILQTA